MIHHIWTVLCTKSITNAETNAVSLLEVPEELVVYTEPNQESKTKFLPLNFDLVSYWERQVEDQPVNGSARLSLVSPEGKVSPQGEYEIDLESYERARLVVRIPGIAVTYSGTYRFRLEFQKNDEWVEATSLPLVIIQEVETNSLESETET